jgi:phage recombination protein Bet
VSIDIVQTGGALAIRPDQTEWTPQQAAVLQQSGISNEVTSAELSGFLHLCQRTQLDPFSRQIYLIGRYDKRAGRTVFTPQTGIDGYRVIAHRVVAEVRQQFGYEDTQWCDKSGQWRDVWLSDAPPAAAKVTVLRQGQRFSAVALFREYCQTGREGQPIGLWGRMPAGQIAKCAEALALRKAFPHDLAGVYTAEEMAQADNSAAEGRQPRQAQQAESDPWATPRPPAAEGNGAVKGRSQEAQNFADRAAQATDPMAVRDMYREANTAGLLTETVKVDRELLALGDYLIARGQTLSAPVPQSTSAEEGIPDAEVLGDQDEHATALDGLRAAALAHDLAANLDADFESSYGVAPANATVEQLRDATALIDGAA